MKFISENTAISYIRYIKNRQIYGGHKKYNKLTCHFVPLMPKDESYTETGEGRSPAGLAVTIPNNVLALPTAMLAYSRMMFIDFAIVFLRIWEILWATKCRSSAGMSSYGSHRQNCRPSTTVAQLSIWKITHKQATSAIQKETTRTTKAELDGNCSIAMKIIATTNAAALFGSMWIVNHMWVHYRTPI